jgi:hypothetical protein
VRASHEERVENSALDEKFAESGVDLFGQGLSLVIKSVNGFELSL